MRCVFEQIVDDEQQSENLKLWNAVRHVDAAHVKSVEMGKRKFTAVDATWIKERATALWGPYGAEWGLRKIRLRNRGQSKRTWTETDDRQRQITCEEPLPAEVEMLAEFYWPGGSFAVTADWPCRKGSDTNKKLQTDCLKKAMTYLGWYADVYYGEYDDDKYKDAKAYYKEKEGRNLSPQELSAKVQKAVHNIKTATVEEAEKFLNAIVSRGFPPFHVARVRAAYDARLSEIQQESVFGNEETNG